MGMFDDLKKAVADTFTEDIRMIDVENLVASEDNFFDVNNIEEFAETILGQGGIKENLIVRPIENEDGTTQTYEIISGHRRTAAVRLLLEKGENISRLLPCLVSNYSDEDTKILDLIFMNTSSRQLSDNEIWKAYEILDRILKSKKKYGDKFGKVRDRIAEMLNISAAQVGKMDNIRKNATDEVKELVEKGELSIATANEISKLEEDEQKKILKSKPVSEIKSSEIKINKEKSAINSTIGDTDEEDCAINSTIGDTDEEDCAINSTIENTDEEDCAINSTIEDTNEEDCAINSTIEDTNEEDCAINSTIEEDKTKISDFSFKLHDWAVNYVKENVHFITAGIDVYLDIADDDETKKAFEALQLIFDDIQQAELDKIKYSFQ
jgi:ParB family chromosome partitioning protein